MSSVPLYKVGQIVYILSVRRVCEVVITSIATAELQGDEMYRVKETRLNKDSNAYVDRYPRRIIDCKFFTEGSIVEPSEFFKVADNCFLKNLRKHKILSIIK